VLTDNSRHSEGKQIYVWGLSIGIVGEKTEVLPGIAEWT